MARIRRANVILDIKDDQIDYYVNQGYDVIDANGGVIKKSTPRDVYSLTAAYNDHLVQIAELQEKINELEAENKKLKKNKASATKKKVK